MSAQTQDPSIAGDPAAADGHVASTTGMGGTSVENVVGADGADGQQGEAQAEGGEQAGASEEGASQAQAEGASPNAALMAELEELRAQSRTFGPVADAINRDPKAFAAVQAAMLGTGDPGGGAPTGVTRSMQAIDEYFSESPVNREALQKVVGPLVEEITELRSKLGRMEPQVQQSHRAAISSAFREGLSANGVNPGDPGVLAALSRERQSPSFQRLERTDPAYAARIVAQSARTASVSKATNAAQSRRVADVKNGSLHSGSGAGSAASARKVFVADRSDPSYDTKILEARLKDPSVLIQFKK